jgi:hypothetical protein
MRTLSIMGNDSSTDAGADQTSTSTSGQGPTWIDMLEDLFDTAVDRQAELECELDDVEIELPLQLGTDPETAHWEIDGTLRFRVDGIGGPLAEWLRWRDERHHPRQQQSDTNPSESEQD